MLRETLINNGLSNRESEVATLVATGLSNREVAEKLFVTEKTVKFHLTNIYKKMSIRSRAQLIVWCLPHMQFIEDRPQNAGNMATAAGTPIRDVNVQPVPPPPATNPSYQQPAVNPPAQDTEDQRISIDGGEGVGALIPGKFGLINDLGGNSGGGNAFGA